MKFEVDDIITTDGYLDLCQNISLNLCHVKPDYFLRGHFIWRGKNHPEELKKNAIISHSDLDVNESISKLFDLVFCINNNSDNDNTISIPLGIPNFCDDLPILKIIGDKESFLKIANADFEKKHLLYSNFSINTNTTIRKRIYDLFSNQEWVLKEKTIQTYDGRLNYLLSIKQSKFVLCPQGNGLDTHRLWESLYMGSIPIVIRHRTYDTCRDLPVLVIENWDEINESFLDEQYKVFQSKQFNLEKLKLSFWKKFIEKKIISNV